MSDGSTCYFNKRLVKIVENNPMMPTKDRILVFQIEDDDWESLSRGEFVSKITKSLLFDVKYIFIEGNSHKYLKFLTSVLSMCVRFMPIVISVNSDRNLFIRKTEKYVDGYCLNIVFPLKDKYNIKDKKMFKDLGERSPEKYKNCVVKSIEIAKKLPLSVIRIKSSNFTEERIEETLSFLRGVGLRIVIEE